MASTRYCPSCKIELSSADKFCRACGFPLSAQDTAANEIHEPAPASNLITCNNCGTQNNPANLNCESCGSVIATRETTKNDSVTAENTTGEKAPPLKRLQSWRITLALGIIFIAVIIVMQWKKETAKISPPVAVPEVAQMTLPENVQQQLQAMEDTVNLHPDDLQAILRLANTLQDNSQFNRALGFYQRYIKLNPTNPDARVDLGVTYFELSRLDSVRHHEYLELAAQTMKEALKIDPKHQMACFNLGIVSLHMGDMDQAKTWLEQCADIDSTTATGRNAKMLISQHSFKNP